MRYLSAGLFFAVTGGHFLLTPYWLRRVWGPSFTTPEELSFHSVVFGFGLLQAVLHVLACTVGISLPAGLAALITLHLLMLAWVTRRDARTGPSALVADPLHRRPAPTAAASRAARRRPAGNREPDASIGPPKPAQWWVTVAQAPLLTFVSLTAIATCVLSWLTRSVQSMQIAGIDAEHYHAPYAVNFAHGVSPFGYVVLGDDHNCPVGASILNAWFFHAFSDPLCLDLVNVLPFVLLLVSLVYLFTLLTGQRGWEWAPIVFLLLFTGKLFRVSLYISADLLYAAAFSTVFTQLCAIWVRNRMAIHEWLALALSVGMLISSKTQGPVSAALLLAFGGGALLARAAVRPQQRPQIRLSMGTLAAGAILLIASGGIWALRNWLYFGSPMAPAGLKLFGFTVFQGQTPTEMPAGNNTALGVGQTVGVVDHLRAAVAYVLPRRFFARSQEWVGTWPAYFSVGLVVLLLDAAAQMARHRGVTDATRRKLFALFFFLALAVVHSHLLVRTRGVDALEIVYGQMLRYIIPIYALFPLLAYTMVFTEALPLLASPSVKLLVVLPALAFLLSHYNDLTRMPPGWIRTYGAEDLVDYRLMPLGAALVAPWCIPLRGPWRRFARYAWAAALGVALVTFVALAVAQDAQLRARTSDTLRRQQVHFQRTGVAPDAFLGILFRTLDDQRRHAAPCGRSRFFMMSFFPYPLEVQDPVYNNLVFFLPSGAAPWAQFLQSNRPGATMCDYVVAAFREEMAFGFRQPPVNEGEIRQWLPPGAQLEHVGDSGHYRAYHVVPTR